MNNYEAVHTNSAPSITESSYFCDISTQIVNAISAGLSCFPQSSSLPGKLLHILNFAFLKPNLNIKWLCKSHL